MKNQNSDSHHYVSPLKPRLGARSFAARLALAALAFLLWARSTSAAPLIEAEVLESMMEAHADNMLALLHAVGPDYGTTLHFTTSLDVGARSFSITLDPGQNFLGSPISMATTGSYDPTLAQYNWLVLGNVSAGAWSASGSVAWTGDPNGLDSSTSLFGATKWSVESEVEYTIDGENVLSIHSRGDYRITENRTDGQAIYHGDFLGTDKVLEIGTNGDILWATVFEARHGQLPGQVPQPQPQAATPSGYAFLSVGTQPRLGFGFSGPLLGKIETSAFPVPEVNPIAAMAFFVGCIGMCRFKR